MVPPEDGCERAGAELDLDGLPRSGAGSPPAGCDRCRTASGVSGGVAVVGWVVVVVVTDSADDVVGAEEAVVSEPAGGAALVGVVEPA